MSCIQVEIKILLYSLLAWIARTWLDCKNKGLSGLIWVTFRSYLFQSTYINILSALKWQASLNLSLNSQKYKIWSYFATQNGFKPNWGPPRLKSQ